MRKTNASVAKPFGCLHSLQDFAARLGRSSQTARRIIEGDAGLRAAARCFSGTVWLPAEALATWWGQQPRLEEWSPRIVPRRAVGGRFFDESGLLTARSEGEARRKVKEATA